MNTKHNFPQLLIFIIGFFITIGNIHAAPPLNNSFNGNWHINLAESEHGENAPVQLLLTQTNDSLFIERTGTDKKSFIERLSFDGKICTCTTTSGRRKSGSAKWDDSTKNSFTETATISDAAQLDEVAFNVTEHWQLSADGKKLTEEITISNTEGAQFTSTAVYDR